MVSFPKMKFRFDSVGQTSVDGFIELSQYPSIQRMKINYIYKKVFYINIKLRFTRKIRHKG